MSKSEDITSAEEGGKDTKVEDATDSLNTSSSSNSTSISTLLGMGMTTIGICSESAEFFEETFIQNILR